MTAPNGNGNGTARWQLWVQSIGVSVAILGATFGPAVFVYGQLLSLAKDIDTARARVDAIQSRLDRVDTRAATNSTDISVIRSNLAEIETQFCAESQVRNLTHASDLRTQALLWHKSGMGELPLGNAYYPTFGCHPAAER